MAYERPIFENGGIYHIYNRGAAKQVIYHDSADYQRFLDCMSYYLDQESVQKFSFARKKQDEFRKRLSTSPTRPMVRIIAYCLMPNHFHIILQQLEEGGISEFMRKVQDSYTRSYNTRYRRIGAIFQGKFKAVHVLTDEQLIHLSRYIHLNPYVAKLVNTLDQYRWSSYGQYQTGNGTRLCEPDAVLRLAGSSVRYVEFVQDFADYAREFAYIKDLALDAME